MPPIRTLVSLPMLLWDWASKRRWGKLVVVVTGIALPVVAGLIAGRISDFGRSTNPKFYELLAAVIPVFFLATFAQYLSPNFPNRPTLLVLVMVVDVMIGEGLSIYAVGASVTTTFLTVASAFALFAQVLDLAVVQVAGAAAADRGKDATSEEPSSTEPVIAAADSGLVAATNDGARDDGTVGDEPALS